jgi:hypothetical protein
VLPVHLDKAAQAAMEIRIAQLMVLAAVAVVLAQQGQMELRQVAAMVVLVYQIVLVDQPLIMEVVVVEVVIQH